MKNPPLVSHEAAAAAVRDALALYCGRGRRYTSPALEEPTGIPSRTLLSYQSGDACPPLHNFLSLACVLGPGFFNAALRDTPFEVRETGPDPVAPAETLAESCAFSASLAEALRDGRIDHRERPEILAHVRALQASLTALAAQLTAVG